MVTTEKLKELSKDELILYNELIEKDIKDVAYYVCLEKKRYKIMNDLLRRMDNENKNLEQEVESLKQKLSRFIGYKNS